MGQRGVVAPFDSVSVSAMPAAQVFDQRSSVSTEGSKAAASR